MSTSSSVKKRKYQESFIAYGFTNILSSGVEKPQCVICQEVLSTEAMKPSKMKRHLESKHPQYRDKPVDFFKGKETVTKRARLDSTGALAQQTAAAVQASYMVSYRIAKAKKPHNIGEELLLPACIDIVSSILGTDNAKKVNLVSLSNDTVRRRIDDMSANIKDEVMNQLQNAACELFAIQLDETTDTTDCAQLLVYARYVYNHDFKDEFLFCSALDTTTTTAQDIFKKVDNNGIAWKNLCGICTYGAPSMIGCRSGFQQLVKEKSPNVIHTHCMIHRQVLASHTLPAPLLLVMDDVIKMVNNIKASPLNHRIFQQLCKEMGSDYEALLYYSHVRWLSRGKVLQRFYILRQAIADFFIRKKKHEWIAKLRDSKWTLSLVYLVDIFNHINELNLLLQGKQMTIIDASDKVKAFCVKLNLWKSEVSKNAVTMFPTTASLCTTGGS